MIGINRRSATQIGYALVDPALKSRANLTWSLRDREDGQMDKVEYEQRIFNVSWRRSATRKLLRKWTGFTGFLRILHI
jgi:hypothetical protein